MSPITSSPVARPSPAVSAPRAAPAASAPAARAETAKTAERTAAKPEVQQATRQGAVAAEAQVKNQQAVQNANLKQTMLTKGLQSNQDLINQGFKDGGGTFPGAADALKNNFGKNINVLAERRSEAIDVPGPNSKVSVASQQAVGASPIAVSPERFADGQVSNEDVTRTQGAYLAQKGQVDVAAGQARITGASGVTNTTAEIAKADRAFALYEGARQTQIDQQSGPARQQEQSALQGERAQHNSDMATAFARAIQNRAGGAASLRQ